MATRSDRNIIDDEDGVFFPVLNFCDFQNFSCGEGDLDDFIKNDAEAHKKELIAVTYSYCLKNNGLLSEPIAFVSLSNDTIKLSKDIRAKLFPQNVNYKHNPAVKIGRFGVDKKYQGVGFGSFLIGIVKDFFVTENRTGCRFITVDAYNNPDTLNFYNKNEFEFITEKDKRKQLRTMYFDLLRLQL